MLKRKSKRVLSIVLAVAMIVGLFPIAAFADEGTMPAEAKTISVDGTTTTLANAAQQANDGDTIQLTSDIKLQTGVDFDDTVTLDLNGHTIADENWTSGDYLVSVKRGGELTIEDSSTDQTGAITASSSNEKLYAAVKITLTGEDEATTPANLIVNGGTLTGYYYGISGNGTRHNTNIEINGGKIVGTNGTGIYHPQDGILTINGGEIIGKDTAVEIRSGKLNISGGSLTANADKYTEKAENDGTTVSGAALAISQHTTQNAIAVTITGGTFKGARAVSETNVQNGDSTKDVTLIISNGTFNGEISSADCTDFITGGIFTNPGDKIADYMAPGNTLDSNGNVTPSADAVAEVNGVGYTSLQDAIDAVPAGGTITILKDIDLDGTGKGNTEGLLTITKDVTIIGNSHKITAKDGTVSVSGNNGPSMINVQSGANVTINDLIINGGTNDTFTAGTKHGININQAGTVTLNDVTIQNNRWYAVMNNGSDLVLKGLTTSGNQWGVNIDNKGGDAVLTVNNAGIAEESSIVFDKGGTGKITATINGGSFRDVVMGKDANEEPITTIDSLIINGGTFKTAGIANAIDVEDYLAPGLVYNPYTGQVYKEPEYTGKYSYEIFTKVGDNGTISVDRYATEGDDVTITVSPDEAYLLDELTVTANGKEVEVKDNGDGTYTFKMPSADAKIVVTFAEDPDWEPEPEEPAMPFTDVNENDWFYDVVLYAYDNGLMTGVSATEFAPNQTTTRGMIVSMLARLEGVTSAEDAGFADVAANDWYATAVNWAASEGIVNGFEDNTFRPNDPITREQLAAMLMNYAAWKGEDVNARADLSDYADAASISSWAEDVLAWANAEGLINGMTATTIDPQGATTRAQTAAMFERFLTAHEA